MIKSLGRNTRRNFQILHNGVTYELGCVIPSMAHKRAHHIVRDYLKAEWLRTGRNADTTANILADGQNIGSVYGFFKNRSVKLIHQ